MGAKQIGKPFQILVTFGMAKEVVVLFEVVEIQEEQAKRIPRFLRPLHLFLQPLVEIAVIVQPR